MTDLPVRSDRFRVEPGWRIAVQIPADCADTVLDAVRDRAPLRYGDYEAVTYATAEGTQSFRSLGTGRNRANPAPVTVPSVELSFFCVGTPADLDAVLEAIYAAHPYEEPVVYVDRTTRTLHIRGLDEDNPNRFWNRSAAPDWVPAEFDTRTAP
ncbi:MAG: hypothetical protein AAGA11_17615 [Pseudomonadota bacterium]